MNDRGAPLHWATLNAEVIAEFRANEGVVGRFGGLPVIILHTVGARTERVREIPLIPVFADQQMYIYATAAGAKKHPGWVYNLRAHCRITVEYAGETRLASFHELPIVESETMLAKNAKVTPQLAEHLAAAAPRNVPIFAVALEPS